VALDPRVGANRLGDDPAALPPGLRAQAEPHIARSPVDPNFLVATFQEGVYTDGSAVNVATPSVVTAASPGRAR
jgi:hypothetical protein